MKILGITGSIGSGKTSITNIISRMGVPTFCADRAVKNIYLRDISFKKTLCKLEPSIKKNKPLKKQVSKIVTKNKKLLKKVEKIIHPLVRRKINYFVKKNRKKKILVLDIPLLIESKMYKKIDIVILIKCSKKIRMRRFLKAKKNIKIFNLMEKKQLNFFYKKRFSDYIIDNNKSLKNTKRKVIGLIKKVKINA